MLAAPAECSIPSRPPRIHSPPTCAAMFSMARYAANVAVYWHIVFYNGRWRAAIQSEAFAVQSAVADELICCRQITRSRNKWKFHLKDGIMNLDGKDYIFQKAGGDAEW